MKQGLKNTLIFLAGAAVGAGGATLAVRHFYTNYIENELTGEIDAELDKIRSDYDARLDVMKDRYETKIEKLEGSSSSNKNESTKKKTAGKTTKATGKATPKQNKEEKIDYTQFSAGSDRKKTTLNDIREEAIQQIAQEKKSKTEDTEIISFEEYCSDEDGMDQLTYTFWQADGVYSDELDQPELDLPHIIGDLIDKYDDYGDGSSLYLMSKKRNAKYEIVINEGSYAEYASAGEDM